MGHRHKDSRLKWTTTDDDEPLELRVTKLESQVKILIAAGGGGGGTTPPAPPADTTPPVAGNVTVTAITQTSVQVSWTTNEAATGQVEYGTTTSYGSTTTLDSTLTLSKSQTVSGLTAGTLYHYRIKASDAVPNAGNSVDRTFTTAFAAPGVPAAPTGLTATPGNTTVSLTWTAISGATYKVYRDTVLVASPTTNSYVDTGRTNGVTYSYKVSAVTGGGEGPQSTAATATPTSPPGDTTPPVISNIVANQITTTTAQISWSLNEPATGQVEYGTTTAYGSTSTLESSFNYASHVQTITGLTPSTTYHFRVISTDAASNTRTSADQTFSTVATPPPPSPSATVYGPGIHMDGIGNTELGGTTNGGNRRWAAIFKASGTRITAFRVQIPNPVTNYSGGDGGLIEYRLRTATSTAPTNTTVGSAVTKAYGMTRPDGIAPQITAPGDWTTVAGDWYALVAKNIDADATTNFTSIDNIDFESLPSAQKVQPKFPDGQWQAFYSDTGTGSWVPRYPPAMTAQMQITDVGGGITGCGYVYRRNVLALSTARSETFTPGSSFPFTVVGFRATGNGTLTLRLERAGVLVSGFPVTVVSAGAGWEIAQVAGTLDSGVSYVLQASGSGLSTYSIEKGAAHGFNSATYFSEGSVTGDSNGDLQFYMA